MINLPFRTKKIRQYGITSIHDTFLPCEFLKQILNDYSYFVDYAKFGIGTALITPNLKEKIELYKKSNVLPYFGGTLFEKFYYEDQLSVYKAFLRENEIGIVEISSGTLNMDLNIKKKLVQEFSEEFVVFCEIGSKDSSFQSLSSEWVFEVGEMLNAGARYIILEGRESGRAGIFSDEGKIKADLVNEIVNSYDITRLIFEAPNSDSQSFFINNFGPNVNLGNIHPLDLLVLESQRNGLKSETFYINDHFSD